MFPALGPKAQDPGPFRPSVFLFVCCTGRLLRVRVGVDFPRDITDFSELAGSLAFSDCERSYLQYIKYIYFQCSSRLFRSVPFLCLLRFDLLFIQRDHLILIAQQHSFHNLEQMAQLSVKLVNDRSACARCALSVCVVCTACAGLAG